MQHTLTYTRYSRYNRAIVGLIFELSWSITWQAVAY